MTCFPKKGRGVTIRVCEYEKCLWFSVTENDTELKKFNSVCLQINNIPDLEMKDTLRKVIELFEQNGFEHIAK